MAKKRGLSFYNRKKRKISSAHVKEIFSWMFGIFTAVFIAVVLNVFLGVATNVVGVSMEPTLYNGQRIYINSFLYLISSPKRGDVVVFLPNGNENAHYYVKRVVAVPGDRVLISGGILYVNGEESPWVMEKLADAGIAAVEFTIQNSEYFCIGDNPGNSEDSRSANVGAVKEDTIAGKAWFKLGDSIDMIGFIE